MKFGLLAYIGLFLLMATSLEQLITENKRASMIALGIQYLAMFLIVIQAWSLSLSAIKLIAGWMATAVLSATQFSADVPEDPPSQNQGRVFRILTGVLIWILVFTITPSISNWLPLPSVILWSGFILIGVGFLQMGMSLKAPRIIIGLLTTLSGFEVLYSAVENSVLVAGFLALITLGVSLIGGYLILAPYLKGLE
jgi:hypothetical protein